MQQRQHVPFPTIKPSDQELHLRDQVLPIAQVLVTLVARLAVEGLTPHGYAAS